MSAFGVNLESICSIRILPFLTRIRWGTPGQVAARRPEQQAAWWPERSRSAKIHSKAQNLLEDRLTHCGHWLDAVFHLTADRSNPLVALKRSTRTVDRLDTAQS